MQKTICALTIAAMALIFACLASAQESPEEAVRKRIKQFEAAYNAGNVDSVVAIYAPDASHTYAIGITHHGREEIAKGLREQFAGPAKGTQMVVTPTQIRPLTPEVVVEEGSFALTGLKDAAGGALPAINGFCLVVYQKYDDQWFIAAAQCMVPLAPPGPR
jgi:uncharacterized protein (TIGR02246 family)